MTTITLGIDISKSKFDVFYTADNKNYHKVFNNNMDGFKALLEHLPQNIDYTAAIEATGSYGMKLADYLKILSGIFVVLKHAIILLNLSITIKLSYMKIY